MRPEQDKYDHFWQKGWASVEGVFEPHEADKVAEIALSVSVSELDENESSYHVDRSDDGQVAPRKIDTPFLKHSAFRELVLDKRLTTLLSELLGGKCPLLKGDQILMKPPRFGSAKPYHQDNFYFRIHPADHCMTAWIALDDVDEANGCLRYIEGSHKEPLLPHEPLPGEPYNLVPKAELIDFSKEVLAPVGKGGVVFHHSRTLHTSYRNESDRWRRGYATHWVTEGVTCEDDSLVNAYYLRDDYPG